MPLQRRPPKPVLVDGVPAELTDPDHPLWHDQDAYRAYMLERGWPLPTAERFRSSVDGRFFGAHPENRRGAARGAWRRENGHELKGWR